MKVCDVMLKKADKKKDRQILFAHKHELADKIRFVRKSFFLVKAIIYNLPGKKTQIK